VEQDILLEILGWIPLLIVRLPLTRQLFIIASYLRPELIHFCAFPAAFFGKFFRREKQAKRAGKLMLKKRKLLHRHEFRKSVENKKFEKELNSTISPFCADHKYFSG